MSVSHPSDTVTPMSNTPTIEQVRYEIDTLTERITANEAIHGPGCRPELRARLRDAQLRIRQLRLAEQRAEARRERDAQLHMLDIREVRPIRVTPEGKWHADNDFGEPECGADGDGVTWDKSPFNTMSGRQFIGRSDCCKRCAKSLWAWARED